MIIGFALTVGAVGERQSSATPTIRTQESSTSQIELSPEEAARFSAESVAANYLEELRQGNAEAIPYVQQMLCAVLMPLAVRAHVTAHPERTNEEISLTDIVATVPIWPIHADGSPWPVVTAEELIPNEGGLIISSTESGLQLDAKAYPHDPGVVPCLSPDTLSIVLSPTAREHLKLRGERGLIARQLGMMLTPVAESMMTGAFPESPGAAYEQVRFSLNAAPFAALREQVTELEFRKAADNSTWGLVARTVAPGGVIVCRQNSRQVGTGTLFDILGEKVSDNEKIDQFMSATESWGTIDALPLVTVSADIRETPAWHDLSNDGLAAFNAARDAYELGLTVEEREAWHWHQSLRLQNPYAVGIVQKCMIDTALRNRFMALRLGAPDQPSPSAESITHAAILDSLLIWPLDEASDAPWPLMWAGEGDQRVPRIELAQADIALFGSQAYKWEFGVTCAFPIEALALYGPEATLELPQKTTFDHHLAFAQALIGVVHFYAEQLGVPERPGDAFQYLHFGINRRAEQQLLGEFPATRFLIRPDRKAYGLLLEAADGRRHFIYRDTEGPSGLTRLGVGRGDQESIAQLMPEFQHWERIEDLSTPRVDLAIPVRSQESTE